MKKLLIATLATSILTAASAAMAGGTATLNVSATVQATCSITGGTLNFGFLDPTLNGAVTANSSGVAVTCTNSTGYTLSDASTNGYKLAFGGNDIPYTINYTKSGTGTGAAQTVAIAGNIAAGTYGTVPAGTYTDTITISVTP